MLKKLDAIKKSVAIEKTEQKALNGGLKFITAVPSCQSVCPSGGNGVFCYVNGNPHCPAYCDGRGGWINV